MGVDLRSKSVNRLDCWTPADTPASMISLRKSIPEIGWDTSLGKLLLIFVGTASKLPRGLWCYEGPWVREAGWDKMNGA